MHSYLVLVTAILYLTCQWHISTATYVQRIGNNGAAMEFVVSGVGAGPFHPKKMSNWHYDFRYPLITPQGSGSCRNIYAANVVNNGETCWNVYFGGWDGVDSCHDSVSVTVTLDSFSTMGMHYPQISTGTDMHCNNPSVIKGADGTWVMAYTQLPYSPQLNKPGSSTGPDGVTWDPNEGGQSWITMIGYPNWENADVNGGNVLWYENDTMHMYFIDFKNYPGVYHAISTDTTNFKYVGISASNYIVNDVKKINGYYVMALHENGPQVFASVSWTPYSFPMPSPLFSHMATPDQYMVSIGLVVDSTETVLLGALYGAGPASTLDENNIFAAWLQRQVLFINDDNTTVWGIGDATRAIGPFSCSLLMNQAEMEGRFWVYDTDSDGETGGTLMYVSPVVTVTQGDMWEIVW